MSIEHSQPVEAQHAPSPACFARSAAWPSLLSRIRSGDTFAVDGFRDTYSRGVRILFQRRVAGVQLDALVDGTVSGAVAQIRDGRMHTEDDWIAYVRSVLRNLCPPPKTDPAAVHDAARVRRKAEVVELRLQGYAPRERQVLVRYFAKGEPVERILADAQMTEQEFRRLKSGLLQTVTAGEQHLRPRWELRQT